MHDLALGTLVACLSRVASAQQAPDEPTTIEIAFEKGNPVAIDGVPMSPATLLTKLNELGGMARCNLWESLR
jgi:argininosuccinate synthase